MVYAPGVPSIEQRLQQAVADTDLVLLDGSFWSDDEPQRCGISQRTSRQMGHVPVTGPHGSLEWLSTMRVPQRVYIHINNTNPMLDESGPEFALIRELNVQVGADGDEFVV